MPGLTGRRIVLVGGAGFIGHNLALRLNELGASVFVIDSLEINNFRYIENNADTIPNSQLYLNILKTRIALFEENNIPLIKTDSRDYPGISKILNELNADTLIHLAAVAHADRSNKDPYSTFDHSLHTLENTLDNARSSNLNINHYIYFSSSMVYGNFPSGFVTEETPCEPLGIYGALKYAGEKMVIAYNQVFKLPYTIIRPSALYGPRCVSRRVGQIFIENALNGLDITIQGDGSDKVDFTYIDDLVSGVINVLENENSKNQIFNMTYGESRSVGQMADMIKKHFLGTNVKYQPRDILMPSRGTLSVDKAKEMIGYDPQFPLEKGFIEYIEWYKSIWDSLSVRNSS